LAATELHDRVSGDGEQVGWESGCFNGELNTDSEQALSHFGEAGSDVDSSFVFYGECGSADVGEAVAYAYVFDSAGDADVFFFFVCFAD